MKTKRIDVDQTLYEITTEWPETATRMGGLVPPDGYTNSYQFGPTI
ncbi:MAG: hypothetical protein O2960_30855 [Verrucomicrobia bacterium]|nr:hypothetical protein [Verrucomicrobiota bacterium]